MSSLNTILPPFGPDRSWTLFIDRDGVINQKRDNDYVKHWGEFIFIPGVLDALSVLSQRFGRLIVVTNQRGIGRGLMTEADLADVHARMMQEIEAAGGKIDRIYHAPHLAGDDHRGWRKPKPGMALQAQEDFPDIDFAKSIVIGDSLSDMMFGRNAGMHTVWVTEETNPLPSDDSVDLRIAGLPEFSQWLERVQQSSSS
ncbi:MAG: HAD family hydrolase [Bacteroidia bacterium]|nr:HAD family hydrolase [Bacteroidia bacterium]